MTTVREQMQDYFVTASWQERTELEPDERLMDVAQYRAFDMSSKGYFAHEDLDGIWPNQHVRKAGYKLPSWYRDDSNQIESIARGYTRVTDRIENGVIVETGALDDLVRSPHHHAHICGLGFWSDHLRYGVGYSDEDERIYVVITAPIEEVQPAEGEPTIFLPIIYRGLQASNGTG